MAATASRPQTLKHHVTSSEARRDRLSSRHIDILGRTGLHAVIVGVSHLNSIFLIYLYALYKGCLTADSSFIQMILLMFVMRQISVYSLYFSFLGSINCR